MAKIPAMAKSQQRMLQGVPTPKDIDQKVIESATAGQLPGSPSQIIRSGLIQQQQRQEMLKQQWLKDSQKIAQMNAYTPGAQMKAQQEQILMQKLQIAAQVTMAKREEVMKTLQPRATVQNSEQFQYVDPKVQQSLEAAYYSRPISKKTTLPELQAYNTYTPNIRHYEGYFINPNQDAQMRPLGNETAKIINF